jgi:thiamine pyrophosphate-dependent acetolactate synthase large subunit-like protein
MMRGDECLKILAEQVTNEVVVCTIGIIGYQWHYYSGGRPALFDCGAMGLASSIGLGLAVGMPHRKVLVLDGDGALLMNLGTLATLAQQNPPNLVHFVFQNSLYESSGGQRLVGADKVDFTQLARGAGFERAYNLDELEGFKSKVDEFLKTPGLTFAALKCTSGERPQAHQKKGYLESKRQFMEFIGQEGG